MGNGGIRHRSRGFALAWLLIGGSSIAGAQAPAPTGPGPDPAAAAPTASSVEERLRKLEAMNQRLLEQN